MDTSPSRHEEVKDGENIVGKVHLGELSRRKASQLIFDMICQAP